MNIAWMLLGFISAYIDTVERERQEMRKFTQELTYALYDATTTDKDKIQKGRIQLARLRVQQEKFEKILKSIPNIPKDNHGK